MIDPKGDRMLREQLIMAAQSRGASFLEWTPLGPLAYNPFGQGSGSEIADKALAGEVFTEPHYLRQAQRYLGHTVRAMSGTNVAVTPASLMAQLDPLALEVSTRSLPDDHARELQGYLDSLASVSVGSSRACAILSILAESDARAWLEPQDGQVIDLASAVAERAVVYFRLDSDRRALLSQMLAAAIVGDLVTLVARLQARPTPTVVMVDEFAAVAAHEVARLFGRARSAGVSLILGAQELADLKTTSEGLREQVLANVSAVITHRQNVPSRRS
ncbi:MAG TPA: hypothetical protein VEJ23_01095 [Solirubrobacteraceae bacterium]|nr:hypothetical protein [Solirubrobacteraceae bacterium]